MSDTPLTGLGPTWVIPKGQAIPALATDTETASLTDAMRRALPTALNAYSAGDITDMCREGAEYKLRTLPAWLALTIREIGRAMDSGEAYARIVDRIVGKVSQSVELNVNVSLAGRIQEAKRIIEGQCITVTNE